jgi:hypothetical protein
MGTSSIMNIFGTASTELPGVRKERHLPVNVLDLVSSCDVAFQEPDQHNPGYHMHVVSSLMERILRKDTISVPKITDDHKQRSRDIKEYFGPMLVQRKLAGQENSSPWEKKLSHILGNPTLLRNDDIGVLASLPRIWQRYQYLEQLSLTCSSYPKDLAPIASTVVGCVPVSGTNSVLLSSKHTRTILFNDQDNFLIAAEVPNFGMNHSMKSLLGLIEDAPLKLSVSGQFHSRELPTGYRYVVCRGAAFEWFKE